MNSRIQDLISKMSLEEKAAFCVGKDFWHLQSLERLGIPQTMVTDGPHGLRKQVKAADHMGLSDSNVAICFPTGSALASSFDPGQSYRLGEQLGKLAKAEDVSAVLGPAMNIKRSPLCGRNFEYYSEDPLVTGKIAEGTVKGVQSQNVGTSPKHFLANNQEYFRMSSNSIVDERTLREIYLPGFEQVVREAKPWTMMCSYNRVNGIHASEHKQFLTDILRDEWGFDGYVMTDWGTLADPTKSLEAGLDLGMPGPAYDVVRQIKDAVQSGKLSEEVVDQAVSRILEIILRFTENKGDTVAYDFETGHAVAADIAGESAVLLKNEEKVLPLKKDEKILFAGPYAKTPRYQGGGSSHIHIYKLSGAMDAVEDGANVHYEAAFLEDTRTEAEEKENAAPLTKALDAAKAADKVVVFAGLPDAWETEGFDRKHLRLPANQAEAIRALAKVQPNLIVVLHNGAPVEMPWIDSAKAVLEMYLGGEAVGLATVRLLYGEVNPSGRLAETFPVRIEDTAAYPYYGVEKENVVYREGIMVGYRYYVTKNLPVLFPFGHGLSYTEFQYADLELDRGELSAGESLKVSVKVTNTGSVAGKEVVQLYLSPKGSQVVRPLRELKAFTKVLLQPGETKTVCFTLDGRSFSYWEESIHGWYAPSGSYEIQIGRNAEDIVLAKELQVSSPPLKKKITVDSSMKDVMDTPVGAQIMGRMMGAMADDNGEEPEGTEVMNKDAMAATGEAMTLRALLCFAPDLKLDQLEGLVQMINTSQENA